jgi:primary-amine oxidase
LIYYLIGFYRILFFSSDTMGSIVKPQIPHPFDPLSAEEITTATSTVKKHHGECFFNVVSLHEPRKAEMLQWLESPTEENRPPRVADVVVVIKSKVYDGLVDLSGPTITKWELMDGVQPIVSLPSRPPPLFHSDVRSDCPSQITMEELLIAEHICRTDPKVIEQCELSGIPRSDMHKVYCDPWTIGFDERHGNKIRLQQALMYYRPDIDTCQYQYPLDFCPILDSEKREIIAIDVPKVRRPLSKTEPVDYTPAAVEKQSGGYRKDLKPINITQPEGVSFSVEGREIRWQNWKFHVGFNYREGIILNDIRYHNEGHYRPIFYRLSLAEMVVP